MKKEIRVPKDVKFPEPNEIDRSKYIEPKKVIFVTRNGITTAELVSR